MPYAVQSKLLKESAAIRSHSFTAARSPNIEAITDCVTFERGHLTAYCYHRRIPKVHHPLSELGTDNSPMPLLREIPEPVAPSTALDWDKFVTFLRSPLSAANG